MKERSGLSIIAHIGSPLLATNGRMVEVNVAIFEGVWKVFMLPQEG
jgi:hypothetical protein